MPDRHVTSDRPLNVLLMGGGGREHSIAWALSRSPRLASLHVTHPENPGLAALGRAVDVPVNVREAYRLQQYCDRHAIDLVVIGPEEPLAEGFADKLRTPTRMVFGPGADGARLEADKAWSKQLMRAASVPTPEARIFRDHQAASDYARSRDEPPVIKAAGLAKGKGVVVPASMDEALEAIRRMMVERVFGDAGNQVLVEERLAGHEVSVLALVDGRSIYVLETAQDHKRLGDNDTGPNTGGMGAFSPSHRIDDKTMARIERDILVPTVDALRRDGIDYRGVLYAGIMLTPAGPKVLEYNCRFGDPECQTLLVRLESDLLQAIEATCLGTLDRTELRWTPGASCCVVLASAGYPDAPRSGVPIEGIHEAERIEGVTIFHAGTRREGGRIVTAGGRVLNVAAVGSDLEEARRRAYAAAELIRFEGRQMRRDIAGHLGKRR